MSFRRQLQPLAIAVKNLDSDERIACELLVAEAFCKELALPDPSVFHTGASLLARWGAQPDGVFGAFVEDRLVGVLFAACWGSFGFFGPLAVDPDYWGRGVAQRLLDEVVRFFDRHQVQQSGLYTFSDSAKHLALYQKYGYWPGFLTVLLTQPVSPSAVQPSTAFSSLDEAGRAQALSDCRALSAAIFAGLDLTGEILALDKYRGGETVLVYNDHQLDAFGLCHHGAGSEAESGSCYIKFAAARDEQSFRQLLLACHQTARHGHMQTIVLGMNTARREAYQLLLAGGYQMRMMGVAMQRPDAPGFNRPGVFVIDDWR